MNKAKTILFGVTLILLQGCFLDETKKPTDDKLTQGSQAKGTIIMYDVTSPEADKTGAYIEAIFKTGGDSKNVSPFRVTDQTQQSAGRATTVCEFYSGKKARERSPNVLSAATRATSQRVSVGELAFAHEYQQTLTTIPWDAQSESYYSRVSKNFLMGGYVLQAKGRDAFGQFAVKYSAPETLTQVRVDQKPLNSAIARVKKSTTLKVDWDKCKVDETGNLMVLFVEVSSDTDFNLVQCQARESSLNEVGDKIEWVLPGKEFSRLPNGTASFSVLRAHLPEGKIDNYDLKFQVARYWAGRAVVQD